MKCLILTIALFLFFSFIFNTAAYVEDDVPLYCGFDVKLVWETVEDDGQALTLALPDNGATNVLIFVIEDQDIIKKKQKTNGGTTK